jgi:hypothetical protein
MLLAAGYEVDYATEAGGMPALWMYAHTDKKARIIAKTLTPLLDHGASRSYRSHLEVDAPEIHPTGELANFIAEYDAAHVPAAQPDH